MATLLHIASSPRGDESASLTIARTFIEAYSQANPDDHVEDIELFEADLPIFDAPAAKAKYTIMGGGEPTGQAEQTWSTVIKWTDLLHGADKLVISAPMWNFGIPYILKQWIDVIVQPGLTFSYDAETGYTGLVTGKPALLCLARGGDYAEGAGMEEFDYQETYLRTVLQFIGFETIKSVIAQPVLLGGPDKAVEAIDKALAEAKDLAGRF